MSNLEMKIDALVRLHLCDDMTERSEILKYLRQLSEGTPEPTPAVDIKSKVTSALLELGVPDSIRGNKYLKFAIEQVIVNPEIVEEMTKVLYPMTAEKFNTTASRVERAIRHAIEVAWDRADFDVLDKYFGNTISRAKGKPTNTEFIARMANAIRG